MVDAQKNLLAAIDELAAAQTPTQIRTVNQQTGVEDEVGGDGEVVGGVPQLGYIRFDTPLLTLPPPNPRWMVMRGCTSALTAYPSNTRPTLQTVLHTRMICRRLRASSTTFVTSAGQTPSTKLAPSASRYASLLVT